MNQSLTVTLTKELQELRENEIARNECCNKTLSHGFPLKQETKVKLIARSARAQTKLIMISNRYPNLTGETFKHPFQHSEIYERPAVHPRAIWPLG